MTTNCIHVRYKFRLLKVCAESVYLSCQAFRLLDNWKPELNSGGKTGNKEWRSAEKAGVDITGSMVCKGNIFA